MSRLPIVNYRRVKDGGGAKMAKQARRFLEPGNETCTACNAFLCHRGDNSSVY